MSWGKYRKVRKFFSSNRKKIRKVDKGRNKDIKTGSYKTKFIDNARFMASSLSNLFDNLAEGIHKIKCKDCNCFFEYESVNDNLMKYKCSSCNKNYSNKIDKKIKKWFKNTFKFSNYDFIKFIFLLRKAVYPYEYMDDLEKFNEGMGKV